MELAIRNDRRTQSTVYPMNVITVGHILASLIAQLVKNRLQCGRPQFDPWVGKLPWRRDRLPTPVFLVFPCGSAGKESTRNAKTWVQSLG